MIHYAHVPAWAAYPLFLLPVLLVAVFPAVFCLLLSRVIARFGIGGIFIVPLIWTSLELARYAITGQLWNAIGYSQAFHPLLIQAARWGGVYAVSFLILLTNAALAFVAVRLTLRAIVFSLSVLILTVLVVITAYKLPHDGLHAVSSESVIAVQPNVPMEGVEDAATMNQLLNRHIELSTQGLANTPRGFGTWRLVIWPESPMNFSYSRDQHLQSEVAKFARAEATFLLLNSLEPSVDGGGYNSAILINQMGEKVAQYDKIRLMPFGEYVPLPQWLPGASSVRGIVGEFTPGNSYTLMPLGAFRAGVFICIEAAHPSIARMFTNEGADVLINISNDGYLGPTPVMRQHLANAVFRAVENDRRLIRVTNSGISGFIQSNGEVIDPTPGFQPAIRTWSVSGTAFGKTFYTRHGDLFVYACALIALGFLSAAFMTRRN